MNGLLVLMLLSSFNILTAQKISTKKIKINYSNGFMIFYCQIQNAAVNKNLNKTYHWYTEESGYIKTKGSYSGLLLHGELSFFELDGRLSQQKHFKNGLLDGEIKQWNDQGDITIVLNYKDGVCFKSTDYDLSSYYKDESKEDLENSYLEYNCSLISDIDRNKSSIKNSCFVCAGIPGCTKTLYSKNSNFIIQKTEWFENNLILTTSYYEFSKQPKSIEKQVFEENKFGYYEQYYENGKIKSKARLIYIYLDGEWIFYDKDGIVEGISLYKDDKFIKIIK